jgi:hypothetical protein
MRHFCGVEKIHVCDGVIEICYCDGVIEICYCDGGDGKC